VATLGSILVLFGCGEDAPAAKQTPAATTAAPRGEEPAPEVIAAAPPATDPAPEPETEPAPASLATEPPAAVPDIPREVATEHDAEGLALLRRMIEAYRAPVVFTDEVEMEHRLGVESPTVSYTVRYGPGSDAVIENPRQTFYVIGDDFYVTYAGSPDRYLKTKRTGDLGQMMGRKRGQLVCQTELRSGRSMEAIIESLAFGLRGLLKVDSYERITDESGTELERLVIKSPSGVAVLYVDPETSFLRSADSEATHPEHAKIVVRRHVEFSPTASDEAPGPVTFDPGTRRAVSTIEELLAVLRPELKIDDGDPMPDFSLRTLEGAKAEFADMRGSVVILHFWSGRRASSFAPLDALDAYAREMEAAGQPVQVWAVNSLEQGLHPGERWEFAMAWWENKRYLIQCLFDGDYALARKVGLSDPPLTLVIGPDGQLVAALARLDPGLKSVRESVDKTLGAAGG
jgi:hypothetical protein